MNPGKLAFDTPLEGHSSQADEVVPVSTADLIPKHAEFDLREQMKPQRREKCDGAQSNPTPVLLNAGYESKEASTRHNVNTAHLGRDGEGGGDDGEGGDGDRGLGGLGDGGLRIGGSGERSNHRWIGPTKHRLG